MSAASAASERLAAWRRACTSATAEHLQSLTACRELERQFDQTAVAPALGTTALAGNDDVTDCIAAFVNELKLPRGEALNFVAAKARQLQMYKLCQELCRHAMEMAAEGYTSMDVPTHGLDEFRCWMREPDDLERLRSLFEMFGYTACDMTLGALGCTFFHVEWCAGWRGAHSA